MGEHHGRRVCEHALVGVGQRRVVAMVDGEHLCYGLGGMGCGVGSLGCLGVSSLRVAAETSSRADGEPLVVWPGEEDYCPTFGAANAQVVSCGYYCVCW